MTDPQSQGRTDRELLEAAAKAAGIEIIESAEKAVVFPSHFDGGFSIRNSRGGDSLWNPLTDDGDALRLAVRLNLRVDCYDDQVETMDGCEPFKIGPEAFTNTFVKIEPTGSDPYAATRRAIVRAAAAIGAAL